MTTPARDARLLPADGLPSSYEYVQEADLELLARDQLERTRKAAESWRLGLAGLTTLLAGLTLLGTPTAPNQLRAPYGVAVGAVLLLALAVAVAGTLWALRAAYGDPQLVTRSRILAEGGVDGYKNYLAERAVRDLRQARWALITSLTLTATATGVAWYAPRAAPAPQGGLRVTSSQGTACGITSTIEHDDLLLVLPGGSFWRTPIATITSMTAVGRCS